MKVNLRQQESLIKIGFIVNFYSLVVDYAAFIILLILMRWVELILVDYYPAVDPSILAALIILWNEEINRLILVGRQPYPD